ncbi:hypothetical protein M5689_005829 [Euphorbia peplus]|nr:hypothetical protein M5689_005829 [Euphorbia peplus]
MQYRCDFEVLSPERIVAVKNSLECGALKKKGLDRGLGAQRDAHCHCACWAYCKGKEGVDQEGSYAPDLLSMLLSRHGDRSPL